MNQPLTNSPVPTSEGAGRATSPETKSQGRFSLGDDLRIERYEAKYIVPYELMPEIRRLIEPYVFRDKNGVGELPQYLVRTIQLDSPSLCLHYAKEVEQLNRFKLRIRTYGTEGTAPVFVEIKRKLGEFIFKSRSVIPAAAYKPELFTEPQSHVAFGSAKEHMNYLDFLRLSQEIGAQPVTMIQYLRESYMGKVEDYARITFDKQICYQMISDYRFDRVNSRRWRRVDTQTGLRADFAGFVLELKSKTGVPRWLMDIVRTFNLVRTGFCKYSAALRLESLSSGYEYSDTSENCVPDSKW